MGVVKRCEVYWVKLDLAGVSFPRTHDLRVLFDLVEGIDDIGVSPFRDLEDLTDYGVQFRYEAPLDLDPLDRPALANRVAALDQWVRGLIDAAV